jgi:mono/diheme cytochrome c family protein
MGAGRIMSGRPAGLTTPHPGRAGAAASVARRTSARDPRAGVAASWRVLIALLLLPAGCAGGGDEVRTLTPAERTLVADGELLFADTCAPCHDGSGAGRAGRAPSLHGSPWVLGAPEVLVRIVFDGVRGGEAETATGYVLPMAAWRLLPDRDVAAVATYVRRAWGHRASPIDPVLVAGVRQATQGRARPWTRDELRAVGAATASRAGGSPP